MKLAASIIASTAMASHYRGGTYKVQQQPNGNINIVNTQTWRLGADLYAGGCQQSDVDNQVVSDYSVTASCTNGSCTSQPLKYTALFVGDDYCYGDGNNEITKPSSGFSFGWDSCCWVPVTDDNGNRFYHNGGDMMMRMTVNDVNNNSPAFKLPPLWLIMAGCPAQQIDLNPIDADGDTVRCRWATQTEAEGAETDLNLWPSLSLDAANCIVTYDGTMDSSTTGVKPIGLMMEDFDANGNVRSSIPVQFLAQVWTPNMNTRSIGHSNYPNWFDIEEHENHVDAPKGRGRRSLPSYCGAVPVFVSPTPADGAILDGKSGSVSFTLAAQSDNGYIVGFAYQAPAGMSCTTVDSNGQITCNWSLTAAQLKVENHSFCYDATDNIGLVTNRQCLTIQGIGNKITNIIEMATEVLDGSGANGFAAADGNDYGCAGRGLYDPFATTLGKQLDSVDKAFYTWKKCVQCAAGNASNVLPYDYDKDADSCANSSSSSRAVCECDRALCNYLYDSAAQYSNDNGNSCIGGGQANTACCNWDTYMNAIYNTDTQCCGSDGVKDVGTC